MIEIKDLTHHDLGRGVVYRQGFSHAEDGVITSWNEAYIFVRYGALGRVMATRPDDLDFLRQE